MVNCFRYGCLDLYLEYLRYVRSLDGSQNINDNKDHCDNIINLIKNNVEKLNDVIKALINKMLLYGNINLNSNETNEFKLEDIYELLELEKFAKDIFEAKTFENINENNLKKVAVILFSVRLYFSNRILMINENDQENTQLTFNKNYLRNKNIVEFFDYSKEKIWFVSLIEESNHLITNISKKYMIDKFIFPIVKENYFKMNKSNFSFSEFKEKREILEKFLNEINLNLDDHTQKNSDFSKTLSTVKEIIKEQFFLHFEQLLNFNVNAVKRYLTKVKDFKKLFSAENQIRNELFLTIQSNLCEILSEVSNQSFDLITDKFILFSLIEKNINSLLNIIQNFFYDDFFLIKLNEGNSEQEKINVKNFKLHLLDIEKQTGILFEFLKNIYESQGLKQYWDKKYFPSKKEEWERFLQID